MTDAEYVAVEKSTIVRSDRMPWRLRLARTANRLTSALAPALAARLAERLFLTPPRRSRRPAAEIALLATAHARPMRVGGRRIETWRWGTGPEVLLVHGWGGRGAQLGAFVSPLVQRGFSVLTFDAPGHGASDSGLVTIPELVTAVHEVTASRLAGIIAHSVGAVAATRALFEGLDAAAAVYVGPPAHLADSTARFAETFGFSRAVRERMRRRVETRVGRPWSAFDVTTMAPMLHTPLLVIHDRGDAEVPWQHGMATVRAWPGAEILMTDALGHRRILHSPDVVAAAVAFVAARTAERRGSTLAAADVVESRPLLAYSLGPDSR
jgi:pimeloyl-ACP methyl ester carboxylesterase